MFTITIDTSKDTFGTDVMAEPQWELAYILRRLAEKLEEKGPDNGLLTDHNGNVVGMTSYYRDQPSKKYEPSQK